MPKKKLAFIINPISGKGKGQNLATLIDKHLDKGLFEFDLFFSEYQGHMAELSIEAMAKDFDIIVAVGGDGSVNEVFPALINSEKTLGIIPLGSGNGLARHLRIPQNTSKAIKLINKIPIEKIDTAEINGHPFINLAGIGFDAEVAKKFSKSKKRGLSTYAKITYNTYSSYKEKSYSLTLNDGRGISEQALMVCFANSNQFGNNFYIAPKADIQDGLIDVCVVKKLPMWAFPYYILLTAIKKIDISKYYKHYQAPSLTLKSKKARIVNVDGEPLKMDSVMEIKVLPSSINVICPKLK